MENKSVWLEDLKVKELSSLKENINVDVLIIGGGMTGITTAYYLKDSSLKVCVVDQSLVGHGVTAKSTAKITYLQDLIYDKLLKTFTHDIASLYLKSQLEAGTLIEKIILENNIKCDYEKVSSYVFTNRKEEIEKLKNQKLFLQSQGIKVFSRKKVPFNLESKYMIKVDDTAVFNPVKYLTELKQICIDYDIYIYEKTKILSINKIRDKYICLTNKNKITAKKVVVACHYPFFIIPFFMPLKAYLERSYICALKTKTPYKLSAITPNSEIKSLRYYKDKYLIYLNGSHNLCNKNNIKQNYENLFNEAKKLEKEICYYWSNEDLITSDNLPYIGVISDSHPNMYLGTGYNTWGMTNGTIAGKIISDLILEKENKYEKIFSPLRSLNLSKLTHLPLNIYSSSKSYIENKIVKNKTFYNENVVFTKIDGENVAIYKDEKGEHIVYNKCPHMKCSLVFNEYEKTWDCLCHSSKFDIDGNCIKGPSRYNISYKKQ